jgi:hypothetical protein
MRLNYYTKKAMPKLFSFHVLNRQQSILKK